MNTLLLTATLSLAASAPLPTTALLSAATAQPVSSHDADYADGYALGQAHGSQVRNMEWALYGAAASCVAGPIGCVGATAAGFLIDPKDVRPRDDTVVVPTAALNTLPPAPLGVSDSSAWVLGYEEGWDDAVQHDRAKLALVSGAVVPVVEVGLYVAYLGFVLVFLVPA